MILLGPALSFFASSAGQIALKAIGIGVFCVALVITGARMQERHDHVLELQAQQRALELANEALQHDLDVSKHAESLANANVLALQSESERLGGQLADIQAAASKLGSDSRCVVGPYVDRLRKIK